MSDKCTKPKLLKQYTIEQKRNRTRHEHHYFRYKLPDRSLTGWPVSDFSRKEKTNLLAHPASACLTNWRVWWLATRDENFTREKNTWIFKIAEKFQKSHKIVSWGVMWATDQYSFWRLASRAPEHTEYVAVNHQENWLILIDI